MHETVKNLLAIQDNIKVNFEKLNIDNDKDKISIKEDGQSEPTIMKFNDADNKWVEVFHA